MDEVVLRALQKWPNVPSVYGWLSLSRRGEWSIKGERLANPAMIAFIARNYARDEQGRWYFQNGPQRVFVTLAYTPFVYRTRTDESGTMYLVAHTGAAPQNLRSIYLDHDGAFVLDAEPGPGVIDDHDLPQLLDALRDIHGEPLPDSDIEALLEERRASAPTIVAQLKMGNGTALPVSLIDATAVAEQFGFDPNPRPAPGEPEC